MSLSDDALVSLVMRTTGGRPREVRRALKSVAENCYRPIEVLIVYQGLDNEEWSFLNRLSAEFKGLIVRIFQNPGQGDRRAQNLNIGWREAQGRYIGFLDDDDTLESRHCRLLVDAIRGANRVWGCSQATLRKEDENLLVVGETRPFKRHRFSVFDLWTENFVPIHSFLIDRESLVPELKEAPFCELLDRSEDWDFLIRLAFFHEPVVIEDVTCNYYVSIAGRNTNLSLMSNSEDERQEVNRQSWARCKRLVEKRKRDLLTRVWWARDLFSGAVPPAPPTAEQAEALQEIPPTAPNGELQTRIVRALIRRLEKLL